MFGQTATVKPFRLLASVGLGITVTASIIGPVLSGFERRVPRSESPTPFLGLTDSVNSPRSTEIRPGPIDRVVRFPYPPSWFSGSQAPSPLAVFVDGKRATWLAEEPNFAELSLERAYAYQRLPDGRSVFAACPSRGCGSIVMVRDDLTTRLAQAGEVPGLLLRFGVVGGLLLLTTLFLSANVAGRLSGRALAATIVSMLALDGLGRAGGPFALLLALASGPWLGRQARDLAALAGRAFAGEKSRAATRFRGAAFALAALIAALPGIYTVIGWYPLEYDDSSFYLFATSRFLRSGDLVGATLDFSNWKYSAYPLLLAVFSKTFGLHPMDAFVVWGFIGPLSLSAAAGAFAWMATGRFTTGLTATLISGLWGGLGGYGWLLHQGREIALGKSLRWIDTNYYEAAYFGEFTGPYSEVAAYLQSMPFYPREAGLVPFWLALGLLYRRLRPDLSQPSLIPIFGLFTLSTAIYPYYGLAAPLALILVGLAERATDAAGRARRRRTLATLLVLVVVCAALGDIAARWYRGDSALNYLSYFVFRAPLKLDKATPSLDFLMPRMLSGEFFFGLAFLAAVILNFRPEGSLGRFQRRAATATLFLCVAHGLLNQASPRLHLVLQNFRWFVSWRSLLTPVAILGAALFLERAFAFVTLPRLTLVALLAMVPALSPVLWSKSSKEYLDRENRSPLGPHFMATHWGVYRDHGRAMLGKVGIPEPLIIEGATVGEGTMALAAFGITVLEAPSHLDLFAPGGDRLIQKLGTPKLASVALRREGPLWVRIDTSDCCSRLTSFGPYDVYVRRPAVAKVESP